jgi:hypothetical protein
LWLPLGLAVLVVACAPAAPAGSSTSDPSLASLQGLDVPDSPSSFAVDLLGGQTGSESVNPCPEPGELYTVDEDTGLGVSARQLAASLEGDVAYQARPAQVQPARLVMSASGSVAVRRLGDRLPSDAGACSTFTEFAAASELDVAGEAAETFQLSVRAVSRELVAARGVNPAGTRRLTLEQTPSGVWGWVEALDGETWRSLAVLQAAEP